MRLSFLAELWEHKGNGAWHFISLPGEDADHIAATEPERRRGFGSVRVEATIGSTTWTTSIFPDNKRKTYVLPVKKEVRASEGLEAGSTVRVGLRLRDR